MTGSLSFILYLERSNSNLKLDFAKPDARLVFSCGWHVTKDGKNEYSWKLKAFVKITGWIAKVLRLVDIEDQVRACDLVFASDKKWTVVRGSGLKEGKSQGLPV